MRHIDDGILHAYLDGALPAIAAAGALPDGIAAADVEAHLRSCADCRARLETERALSARARAVLDDVRPAVIDAPPFELIGARAPTPARRRSSLPYAWAASVVLAVGAGWVAGELMRRDSAFDTAPVGPAVDAAERSAAAAPLQEQAKVGNEPGASEQQSGQAHTPAAPAAPRTAIDSSRLAGNAASREAQGRAGVQSAVAGADPVKPLADDLATSEARRGRDAGAVSRMARETAADTGARTVAGAQASSAPLSAAAAPAPPPTTITSAAFAATAPLPETFRAHVQQARAGTLMWLPLSQDDQRRSETPVLSVADADPPAVERAVLAPGGLLRVRQRLASGEEVELLVWREPRVALDEIVVTGAPLRLAPRARQEAAEPARSRNEISASELAGGVRELILHEPASDTWIALSGAVPLSLLREAAARLVEPRR